jgi:predicted Zn-dependent peptidase
MDSLSDSAARILEIESRQDEALRELETLELRIEQVLAEQLAAMAKKWPPKSAAADKAA